MTKYRWVSCIISLSVLITCSRIAVAAADIPLRYHVTDLGTLNGFGSEAHGINARGQVTGYSDTPQGPNHAFIWSPTMPNGISGTLQDLGPTVFENSAGYAINENGQVTGECCIGLGSDGTHAFLYDGMATHDLGTLGGPYSSGRGINAAGQVTGYSWTAGGSAAVIHAFLYDGTMHDLGALSDYHSLAFAINDSGQVTGYSYTPNFGCAHAFLWTPTTPGGASGTMHDLGTLSGDPDQFSTGYGINASGQVTGESGGHAFLWTPATPNSASGTMHDLGTLSGDPAGFSLGLAINASGHVTGYSITAGRSHAFLYTSDSGMVDLNSLINPRSGWDLSEATSVNDAGQITGRGHINGEGRAFLLTPVPEPTTGLLMMIGGSIAIGLILRKRKGTRRDPSAAGGLIAASVVCLATGSASSAATFNASTVAELISAIHAANQNTEADSIALAAGTTFTLNLANISTNGPTGLPTIAASESLSIFGNGATIERSTAIETPAFRLFDVAAGASLSLENLTLQRGRAFGAGVSAQGGAILNQGTLALQNVIVQNNSAVGRSSSSNQIFGPQPAERGAGGGIFSSGSLTVEGGAMRDNLAIGGNGAQSISARGGGTFPSTRGGAAYGGGLHIAGGIADLSDVSFVDNGVQGGKGGNGHATHGSYGGANGGGGYGGGLYMESGSANLFDVVLASNSVRGGAGGNGGNGAFTGDGGDGGPAFGGALRFASGTVILRDSFVTNNVAQAGAGGIKGSASGSSQGAAGLGQGGGLYIGIAQVGLDEFTEDHVTSNTASTSNPNIYGPFEVLPNQLAGDYNGDGSVDAADYTVWRDGIGSLYTQSDYNIWRANFGATLSLGSSSALRSAESQTDAVPEPESALLLLSLAAVGTCMRRHFALRLPTTN